MDLRQLPVRLLAYAREYQPGNAPDVFHVTFFSFADDALDQQELIRFRYESWRSRVRWGTRVWECNAFSRYRADVDSVIELGTRLRGIERRIGQFEGPRARMRRRTNDLAALYQILDGAITCGQYDSVLARTLMAEHVKSTLIDPLVCPFSIRTSADPIRDMHLDYASLEDVLEGLGSGVAGLRDRWECVQREREKVCCVSAPVRDEWAQRIADCILA